MSFCPHYNGPLLQCYWRSSAWVVMMSMHHVVYLFQQWAVNHIFDTDNKSNQTARMIRFIYLKKKLVVNIFFSSCKYFWLLTFGTFPVNVYCFPSTCIVVEELWQHQQKCRMVMGHAWPYKSLWWLQCTLSTVWDINIKPHRHFFPSSRCINLANSHSHPVQTWILCHILWLGVIAVLLTVLCEALDLFVQLVV